MMYRCKYEGLITIVKYFVEFLSSVFSLSIIKEDTTQSSLKKLEVSMVSYAVIDTPLTTNLGDIIAQEPQTIAEKAQQVAVDKYDITGAHIKVPTYFVVKYPNGETKALHHVRDAKAISDVIQQMHLEEEDSMTNTSLSHRSNLNGLVAVLGVSSFLLILMTTTIVLGIF